MIDKEYMLDRIETSLLFHYPLPDDFEYMKDEIVEQVFNESVQVWCGKLNFMLTVDAITFRVLKNNGYNVSCPKLDMYAKHTDGTKTLISSNYNKDVSNCWSKWCNSKDIFSHSTTITFTDNK